MTVIVFDGRTLAADRQMTINGMRHSVTKIHRFGDLLVGCAGDADSCNEMIDWVKTGRWADRFPDLQRTDRYCSCMVIDGGKILLYWQSPVPHVIEDPVCAIGSGRDVAVAAVMCGSDARGAVKIACSLIQDCGMGIDAIDLYPEEPDAA